MGSEPERDAATKDVQQREDQSAVTGRLIEPTWLRFRVQGKSTRLAQPVSA
jgi:hypothetical protein